MPHFFNKKELTQEQMENWNRYVDMYEKTLGFNVNRQLIQMQNEDKEKFVEMFQDISQSEIEEKMIQNAQLMGNFPGDEKSALFFRLISGKKPFLYRVPLSYSYPDYDIMENENSRELDLDSLSMNAMVKNKKLAINQCSWKVLKHTDTYAEVTFGDWEKLGFIWSVELKDLKAQDSQKAIISHHNPDLIKINTYEDLVKEVQYQVKNQLRKILINIDENEAQKMKEEYKKYGNLAEIMYQQEELRGKDMLAQRREQNLSDYPSEEELEQMVNVQVPQYLGHDYYVIDNQLYVRTWVMEKLTNKKMKPEYYLEMK